MFWRMVEGVPNSRYRSLAALFIEGIFHKLFVSRPVACVNFNVNANI